MENGKLNFWIEVNGEHGRYVLRDEYSNIRYFSDIEIARDYAKKHIEARGLKAEIVKISSSCIKKVEVITEPEKIAFDNAIEFATIKLNVALLSYRENNPKWARERENEAKAILKTTLIFTGRNVSISYNDLEMTGYKLIENQYEKDERVIYESK